jgi:hypothetical protein
MTRSEIGKAWHLVRSSHEFSDWTFKGVAKLFGVPEFAVLRLIRAGYFNQSTMRSGEVDAQTLRRFMYRKDIQWNRVVDEAAKKSVSLKANKMTEAQTAPAPEVAR